MRARIIHYNDLQGRGVLASANGTQFDFDIRMWRSDRAPATNAAVRLSITDGLLTGVMLDDAPSLLARILGGLGRREPRT
jgi:hypothetical protein